MSKPIKEIKNLATKLQYSNYVTHTTYLLLLGLLTYWNFSRASGPSIGLWLLQSLPLMVLAPGMFARYYRTYSWLCFILLGYFIVAVERTMISTSTHLDSLFLALVVVLFISSMLTSRWLQYFQKSNVGTPSSDGT